MNIQWLYYVTGLLQFIFPLDEAAIIITTDSDIQQLFIPSTTYWTEWVDSHLSALTA